jgi:hypothetical protein
METLAKFNINDIVKGFDYNGEFLDKSDLTDLLSNYDFNNKDELLSYLNDEDGNYIGDTISELSDSKIDCYNHNLRLWAVDNYNYIEDAISEFGIDDKNPDFHKMIQQGQYYAYSNEFYNLVSEFKDYIESIDFEEEEEEEA